LLSTLDRSRSARAKSHGSLAFWNGATAPLGYKVIEAEKRGTKIKKKLDVDPVEAKRSPPAPRGPDGRHPH